MHETPSETLKKHLRLGRDCGEARDELDERLARKYANIYCYVASTFLLEHIQYVSGLPGSDPPSEESDSESSDSEEERSTSRSPRTKNRVMSIITNQYLDPPPIPAAQRKFFHSGMDLDEYFRIEMEKEDVLRYAKQEQML
jgi:hypothetical protein